MTTVWLVGVAACALSAVGAAVSMRASRWSSQPEERTIDGFAALVTADAEPIPVAPTFFETPSGTSVFIAHGDRLYRDGLAKVFASHFQVAGTAGDARTAFERIYLLKPDVVLVSPRLLNIASLALLPPETAAVVMSPHLSRTQVTEAFDAGATAYLSEHADLPDLLEAVAAAARGERRVGREVLRRHQAEAVRLTELEREVLRLLMAGRTVHEVSGDLDLSPSLVRQHLQRVYKSLGVAGRTAAITEETRQDPIE